MKLSTLTKFIFVLLILALAIGCSKSRSDYKAGIYWLEKENNWQMAVKKFQSAVEKDPGKWKIHAKLFEAMGMGAQPEIVEQQLRHTLSEFPDSAWTAAIEIPGTKILGEDRYNRVAGSLVLKHLSSQLAKDRDDLELISKCIMAACRVKDSIAVVDYYKMGLSATEGTGLPDSALQEIRFYLGKSQIDWLNLEWKVERNPQDAATRVAQIDAGILLGDSVSASQKLRILAAKIPESAKDKELAIKYGRLVGYDPFQTKVLTRGWDASISHNGKTLIFIKNMGDEEYPDLYIYKQPFPSGSISPVLKAVQHTLDVIAWPKFSPDDNWIYFYASKDKQWEPGNVGRFHLYRVKPFYNSRPEKLTDSDLVICDPFFKDDGNLFLVRRDIGSTRASVEIVELDPESKNINTISRIGEPVSGAVFSANGDSLIFITDRGIFRRSINGGLITVDLQWIGMKFPQLSPDGKWLKMLNRSDRMLIIDRTNPEPIFIGKKPKPWISFIDDSKILLSEKNGNDIKASMINLKNSSVDPARFFKKIMD